MMTRVKRRPGFACAVVIAVLVALGCAALPTNTIEAWFAHPVRVSTLGQLPQTTIEGARWFRLALMIGPLVLVAIALGLSRLRVSTQQPNALEPNRSSTTYFALSLLIALAVILRSIKLGDSLWYDEIAGLLGYSIHGPGPIIGNYYSQANQVFSQLTIWCSARLFGVDELSVRLPAFLAGIAAVPAAWALGREARGEGTGLFAATAVALMPVAILASCDARGYSLVILFATLATWLLLRSRRTLGLTSWSAFAVVVALMIWTHLASTCVAIGFVIFLVFDFARGHDRRCALAGLLALLGAARSRKLSKAGASLRYSSSLPALTLYSGGCAM